MFSSTLLKSSWKTTLGGVLAGLAMIFGKGHLEYLFDGDPETTADLTFITAGAGVVWAALFSRDNDVSDEQAAAGVTPKTHSTEVADSAYQSTPTIPPGYQLIEEVTHDPKTNTVKTVTKTIPYHQPQNSMSEVDMR